MLTKLQKWGNSIGLRVPSNLARELHIESGSEVELRIVRGKLVISPVNSKDYSLDQLLSKVTPENIHSERDLGSPTGRETW